MDRRSTMALEIALDEVNGTGSRTLESMRKDVGSHAEKLASWKKGNC